MGQSEGGNSLKNDERPTAVGRFSYRLSHACGTCESQRLQNLQAKNSDFNLAEYAALGKKV